MNRNQTKHTREFSAKLETRNDDQKRTIEGYFAVFNQETELFPGAFEKIDRGAFESQLNADVRALINHDTTLVIGRTTAGTLRLRTDDHGLYGEVDINENDTDAMNLYHRVQRGDVSQCSFGFYIKDEDTDTRNDGTVHWTIKDVELFEVSCCSFPAYQQTGINAREKEVEQMKSRATQAWKEKMKGRIRNGVKNADAE